MMRTLMIVAMVTGRLVNPQQQLASVSLKVNPSMPSDLTQCFLGQYPLKSPSPLACAALCQRTTDCLLYCIKGFECSLFNAWVTVMWMGDSSGIMYDKCFSVWSPAVNDITHFAANITSSGVFAPDWPPENAVNGFYCMAGALFCSHTNYQSNAWWSADLGAPRTISSIIISTKRFSQYSYFKNVKVTLGDSSDYNNNPSLGYYKGLAPIGKVVTFMPPTPMTGRYLKLQSNSPTSSYFIICDILLIGPRL